jgi:hypothetical protein
VTQVVKHLLYKHEAQSSNPSPVKKKKKRRRRKKEIEFCPIQQCQHSNFVKPTDVFCGLSCSGTLYEAGESCCISLHILITFQ